ncbi:hypothetical protein AAU61_01210 [Desulfocarbo indianensis]|nr:hypothetical protein AAU61_01210 [Desulfocarbo indianensis]
MQKKIILILMAQLLFLSACQDTGPGVSDKARKFRDAALAYLEVAKQDLAQVRDLEDQVEVGSALTRIFPKARESIHGLPRGLLFLNRSGEVVAGRYPDPKAPDGLASVTPGHNYGNYQAMRQALQTGENAQFLLYIYNGKFCALCSPLKRDGAIVGLICLAFSTEVMSGRMGVSEEVFLALDFNS